MIYTNRGELPGPMFKALTTNTYSKGKSDISVTELLKSPQERLLAKRHEKEIVKDAADQIWSVLGTAVHSLMEKHAVDHNGIVEERLFMKVKGPLKEWTISGATDLIDEEDGIKTITDYKVAGVFSYLLERKRGGVKEDWEEQLNLNRLIVKNALGWDCDRLRIALIIRDWMKSKVGVEEGYPAQPILYLDANVWSFEKIEKFLADRITVHQEAEALPDDALPPCSVEEKWERGEKWAVMKGANKRAEKLCDSDAEARAFAADVPNSKVVHRPGKPTKCLGYCDGAAWCSQFAQYKRANGIGQPVEA